MRAETRISWGVFMSKVAIDVLPHNSIQPHKTHEADAVDAAGTFLKTLSPCGCLPKAGHG